MLIVPPIKFFMEWQLCHYRKRADEAKDPAEKSWLQQQYSNIKKSYDEKFAI